MRRYKIVTCILILSVFSVVLAAPVAVQEVREAGADAVDGGDEVIIGLGKRTGGQEEESQLPLQGSTSIPNDESRTRPNPSFSPGESRTELSWNSEGQANVIQPGTLTEIQPLPPRPLSLASSAALPLRPQPKPQPKSASEFIFSLLGRPKFWRER
ncbi:hypothetical protein BGY98DRAFT_951274 [Russula aff. rugulosa BPL654]|nr:hypothetical protein BGY98DRAFT_951274 [Russula aff. rugulosa BPL654]